MGFWGDGGTGAWLGEAVGETGAGGWWGAGPGGLGKHAKESGFFLETSDSVPQAWK